MGYLEDYAKARFFGANDKTAKTYADTKRIANWISDDKKTTEHKSSSSQSTNYTYNQNSNSNHQNSDNTPKKETVNIDYSTFRKLQVPVKFKYEKPNDGNFYNYSSFPAYNEFEKGKGFIGDDCIVKINSTQYEYLMKYLEKLFNCKTFEQINHIYTVWVINSKLEYLKYFLEITNDYHSVYSRVAYLFNTARLSDAVYNTPCSRNTPIKQEKKQLTPKQKELLEEFLTLICKSKDSSEFQKVVSLWLNTSSLSFIKEIIPRTIRFHYWNGNSHIFNETRQFFYIFAQKNNLTLNLTDSEKSEVIKRLPSEYYEKVGLSFPLWEEERSPYEIPF